jgi:hypothetical protein
MQMKLTVIQAVIWFCFWMIKGITGNPVPRAEIRESSSYGLPLTEAELNCIPSYSLICKKLHLYIKLHILFYDSIIFHPFIVHCCFALLSNQPIFFRRKRYPADTIIRY